MTPSTTTLRPRGNEPMTDQSIAAAENTSEPRLRDQPERRPVAARRLLHEGMVWDLVRDTIDFAEGVRFDREYVWHTGAVAVLALDEADRVLMIRQYRHPVGHELWEIPAGLLDQGGEAPHLAAARELGIDAHLWPRNGDDHPESVESGIDLARRVLTARGVPLD